VTCIALLSDRLDLSYLLPAFREQFPDADLRQIDQLGALEDIEVAVCWYPPPGLLARMPKLRLVQAVGAGIDHITRDARLPAVPICRIVDPGMASGMAAYVAWAVVHRQRCMQAYVDSARIGEWREQPVATASQHRVGIAGLGVLGTACARALGAIGYQVRGWSRTPKPEQPTGVEVFHGGTGRDAFLAGCDTLVCLLPLTAQTEGILCAELFTRLPPGAHLINVGRGAHLVEDDLLDALNGGLLGAATLDVCMQEPLPPEHPFWHHPRILVTPHVATRTHPTTIARQTFSNLARLRLTDAAPGAPAATVADLERGY
jgi:glyoxylate/hydroxypyruvate reductase